MGWSLFFHFCSQQGLLPVPSKEHTCMETHLEAQTYVLKMQQEEVGDCQDSRWRGCENLEEF